MNDIRYNPLTTAAKMPADWLQLLNCDEIVGLNTHAFPDFVKRHTDLLGEFNVFRSGVDDVPVADRIERLLERGETEASLRADLADALCFSERMVYLHYWGCYVEVFASADAPPLRFRTTASFQSGSNRVSYSCCRILWTTFSTL